MSSPVRHAETNGITPSPHANEQRDEPQSPPHPDGEGHGSLDDDNRLEGSVIGSQDDARSSTEATSGNLPGDNTSSGSVLFPPTLYPTLSSDILLTDGHHPFLHYSVLDADDTNGRLSYQSTHRFISPPLSPANSLRLRRQPLPRASSHAGVGAGGGGHPDSAHDVASRVEDDDSDMTDGMPNIHDDHHSSASGGSFVPVLNASQYHGVPITDFLQPRSHNSNKRGLNEDEEQLVLPSTGMQTGTSTVDHSATEQTSSRGSFLQAYINAQRIDPLITPQELLLLSHDDIARQLDQRSIFRKKRTYFQLIMFALIVFLLLPFFFSDTVQDTMTTTLNSLSSPASAYTVPTEHYDNVGELLRKMNFRAKHPVIMIPGIVTSALEAWSPDAYDWSTPPSVMSSHAGKSLFENDMLNASQQGGHSSEDMNASWKGSSSSSPPSDTTPPTTPTTCTAPTHRTTVWGGSTMLNLILLNTYCFIDYLRLNSTTGMDNNYIKLRPVDGISGGDYLFGPYWVWARVIANLDAVGYDSNTAYLATFDWRLSMKALELRDMFFSRLKARIELFVQSTNEKAVILTHSMGGLVYNYFYHYVHFMTQHDPRYQHKGWFEQHIHAVSHIAVPFLGVPKASAALLSGEMKDIANLGGFGNFLRRKTPFSDHNVLSMLRAFHSVPTMFPKGGELVWGDHLWSVDDLYGYISLNKTVLEEIYSIDDLYLLRYYDSVGHTPSSASIEGMGEPGLTLQYACNRFIHHQQHRNDTAAIDTTSAALPQLEMPLICSQLVPTADSGDRGAIDQTPFIPTSTTNDADGSPSTEEDVSPVAIVRRLLEKFESWVASVGGDPTGTDGLHASPSVCTPTSDGTLTTHCHPISTDSGNRAQGIGAHSIIEDDDVMTQSDHKDHYTTPIQRDVEWVLKRDYNYTGDFTDITPLSPPYDRFPSYDSTTIHSEEGSDSDDENDLTFISRYLEHANRDQGTSSTTSNTLHESHDGDMTPDSTLAGSDLSGSTTNRVGHRSRTPAPQTSPSKQNVKDILQNLKATYETTMRRIKASSQQTSLQIANGLSSLLVQLITHTQHQNRETYPSSMGFNDTDTASSKPSSNENDTAATDSQNARNSQQQQHLTNQRLKQRYDDQPSVLERYLQNLLELVQYQFPIAIPFEYQSHGNIVVITKRFRSDLDWWSAGMSQAPPLPTEYEDHEENQDQSINKAIGIDDITDSPEDVEAYQQQHDQTGEEVSNKPQTTASNSSNHDHSQQANSHASTAAILDDETRDNHEGSSREPLSSSSSSSQSPSTAAPPCFTDYRLNISICDEAKIHLIFKFKRALSLHTRYDATMDIEISDFHALLVSYLDVIASPSISTQFQRQTSYSQSNHHKSSSSSTPPSSSSSSVAASLSSSVHMSLTYDLDLVQVLARIYLGSLYRFHYQSRDLFMHFVPLTHQAAATEAQTSYLDRFDSFDHVHPFDIYTGDFTMISADDAESHQGSSVAAKSAVLSPEETAHGTQAEVRIHGHTSHSTKKVDPQKVNGDDNTPSSGYGSGSSDQRESSSQSEDTRPLKPDLYMVIPDFYEMIQYLTQSFTDSMNELVSVRSYTLRFDCLLDTITRARPSQQSHMGSDTSPKFTGYANATNTSTVFPSHSCFFELVHREAPIYLERMNYEYSFHASFDEIDAERSTGAVIAAQYAQFHRHLRSSGAKTWMSDNQLAHLTLAASTTILPLTMGAMLTYNYPHRLSYMSVYWVDLPMLLPQPISGEDAASNHSDGVSSSDDLRYLTSSTQWSRPTSQTPSGTESGAGNNDDVQLRFITHHDDYHFLAQLVDEVMEVYSSLDSMMHIQHKIALIHARLKNPISMAAHSHSARDQGNPRGQPPAPLEFDDSEQQEATVNDVHPVPESMPSQTLNDVALHTLEFWLHSLQHDLNAVYHQLFHHMVTGSVFTSYQHSHSDYHTPLDFNTKTHGSPQNSRGPQTASQSDNVGTHTTPNTTANKTASQTSPSSHSSSSSSSSDGPTINMALLMRRIQQTHQHLESVIQQNPEPVVGSIIDLLPIRYVSSFGIAYRHLAGMNRRRLRDNMFKQLFPQDIDADDVTLPPFTTLSRSEILTFRSLASPTIPTYKTERDMWSDHPAGLATNMNTSAAQPAQGGGRSTTARAILSRVINKHKYHQIQANYQLYSVLVEYVNVQQFILSTITDNSPLHGSRGSDTAPHAIHALHPAFQQSITNVHMHITARSHKLALLRAVYRQVAALTKYAYNPRTARITSTVSPIEAAQITKSVSSISTNAETHSAIHTPLSMPGEDGSPRDNDNDMFILRQQGFVDVDDRLWTNTFLVDTTKDAPFKIYNLYGTNLPTERSYTYTGHVASSSSDIPLSSMTPSSFIPTIRIDNVASHQQPTMLQLHNLYQSIQQDNAALSHAHHGHSSSSSPSSPANNHTDPVISHHDASKNSRGLQVGPLVAAADSVPADVPSDPLSEELANLYIESLQSSINSLLSDVQGALDTSQSTDSSLLLSLPIPPNHIHNNGVVMSNGDGTVPLTSLSYITLANSTLLESVLIGDMATTTATTASPTWSMSTKQPLSDGVQRPTLREFSSMDNYSTYLLELDRKEHEKGIFSMPTVTTTVDSLLLPFRLRSADHVDILGNDNMIIDILHIIGQYKLSPEDVKKGEIAFEYKKWALDQTTKQDSLSDTHANISFQNQNNGQDLQLDPTELGSGAEYNDNDEFGMSPARHTLEDYLQYTPAYPAIYDYILPCSFIEDYHGGAHPTSTTPIVEQYQRSDQTVVNISNPQECLTQDGRVVLFDRIRSTALHSADWINRLREYARQRQHQRRRGGHAHASSKNPV